MKKVAELDERIDKCLSILGDNPDSRVFAALADAYRKRGEFSRAFSTCQAGLTHHPDFAAAHVVMAKLYRHQRMFDKALSAIRQATQCDGPSHVTDTLETEVLIDMGDLDGARAILTRLKATGGQRSHTDQLDEQLALAQKKQVAATKMKTGHAPSSARSVDDSHQTTSDSDDAKTSSLTWKQWETAVRNIPHVSSAYAWDAEGDPMAGITDNSKATDLSVLFRTVADVLRSKTGASLEEIRIETKAGEVWCGRLDECVIGLIGNADMSFGAVRQEAVSLIRKIDSSSTVDGRTT